MAASASSDRARGAPPSLALELLPEETRGQLQLVFRVAGDHQAYRLLPVRDPRQPRFWGLAVIERFGDIAGTLTPLWAGHWDTDRLAIPALLAGIREDPAAWIGEPERADLRRILGSRYAPAAVPAPRRLPDAGA